MDDPAARTRCPTCGRPLPLPEIERRPNDAVTKILAVCRNGHCFTAQQHDYNHTQGHWYTGLAPEPDA